MKVRLSILFALAILFLSMWSGVWAGPVAQTIPTAPPGTEVATPTPLAITPPPAGGSSGNLLTGLGVVIGIGVVGFLIWQAWRRRGGRSDTKS